MNTPALRLTDYFSFEYTLSDETAKATFYTFLEKNAQPLLDFITDFEVLSNIQSKVIENEPSKNYSYSDDVRLAIEEVIQKYFLKRQTKVLPIPSNMKRGVICGFNMGENVFRLLEAISLYCHAKLHEYFQSWLTSSHFDSYLTCVVLDRQRASLPAPAQNKLFTRKRSASQMEVNTASMTEMNATIINLRSHIASLEEQLRKLKETPTLEELAPIQAPAEA